MGNNDVADLPESINLVRSRIEALRTNRKDSSYSLPVVGDSFVQSDSDSADSSFPFPDFDADDDPMLGGFGRLSIPSDTQPPVATAMMPQIGNLDKQLAASKVQQQMSGINWV